jgi:hypothetical protein
MFTVSCRPRRRLVVRRIERPDCRMAASRKGDLSGARPGGPGTGSRLDSGDGRDIFIAHVVVAFASRPSSSRIHRARLAMCQRPAADWQRLDRRNQVRRLPPAGPARWPAGMPFHPQQRFPLIRQGMAALQVRSCLIDGEAVCCEVDGVPSFELLRYRHHDGAVFLYAFDLLELDGRDRRRLRNVAPRSPSCCDESRAACIYPTTSRPKVRSSSGTPACSASRALSRRAGARPIAQAVRPTASSARIRRHRRSSARPKRIGAGNMPRSYVTLDGPRSLFSGVAVTRSLAPKNVPLFPLAVSICLATGSVLVRIRTSKPPGSKLPPRFCLLKTLPHADLDHQLIDFDRLGPCGCSRDYGSGRCKRNRYRNRQCKQCY